MGAPDDANDTSKARAIPQADNPPVNASVEELYSALRDYEAEIQQNHLAVNAAKQSLSKGQSFPEVYSSLKAGVSRMPGFDELIKMQLRGNEWMTSASSNASGGLQIESTADLNNYRGLLGQATRQAGLAQSRLEGLFGAVRQAGNPGMGQGNGKPGSGGLGGSGNGTGSGMGGSGEVSAPGGGTGTFSAYSGSKLSKEMVRAQALPGRRFSKDAKRKGWLYINTWYMIGPWESFGREDFSIVHPPEISIDFDAVYTDGQVGTGIAETDSDPLKVIGDEVRLDGALRWKFMQSESMHNVPPVTTDIRPTMPIQNFILMRQPQCWWLLARMIVDVYGLMEKMYGVIMALVGIILMNILLLFSSDRDGIKYWFGWKMEVADRVGLVF
ncbi:hypothetical protein BFINE_43670 [Bacteroides finegoldii DSM 17565]|nr:hypothetical protein BFINE_43670 [Bacteroides finegoldii DSM 17565]